MPTPGKQTPKTNKSRRRFIVGAATGGAIAAGAFGVPLFVKRIAALSKRHKTSANGKIAVGVIGAGVRGNLLIQQLPESAQLVTVCDCNSYRANYWKKDYPDIDTTQDYREVLDRKDVDAVIVATAEFQRILPCIHALQAGKDIYAEKPLSLYIREGRALVKAVKRYNRILQVGTQQRSMATNRVACEMIRSGKLGKVIEAQAVNYSGPMPMHPTSYNEKLPSFFDWNTWLNQAAGRDFGWEWPDGWRLWRDFSGGEMTDWGAHGLDQIQWALGTDGTGPVEMKPLSPGLNGQVAMRYANGVPLNFILPEGHGTSGGGIFICEKGKLEIGRNRVASNPSWIVEEIRKHVNTEDEERRWDDPKAQWQARWHLQDWLDCIRSRKQPVATAEIGHRSVTICHLANIVRELGRPLKWDPTQEQFTDDAEANKYLERPRRKGFELPTVD